MVVLELYKRDAKTYTLYFRDSSGTAVDITGDTIFFTVKVNKTDPDLSALISKTITSHTNPTGGISTITLSSTDTAITAAEYYFDIKRKHGTNIKTIENGIFKVNQEITIRTS